MRILVRGHHLAGYDAMIADFTSSRYTRLQRITELQTAGCPDDILRSSAATWPSPPPRSTSTTQKVH